MGESARFRDSRIDVLANFLGLEFERCFCCDGSGNEEDGECWLCLGTGESVKRNRYAASNVLLVPRDTLR